MGLSPGCVVRTRLLIHPSVAAGVSWNHLPNKSLAHGFLSQRLLLWERQPRQLAITLKLLLCTINSARPWKHTRSFSLKSKMVVETTLPSSYSDKKVRLSGYRMCRVGGVEGSFHHGYVCIQSPCFAHHRSFSGRVCMRVSRFTRSFGTKAECLS